MFSLDSPIGFDGLPNLNRRLWTPRLISGVKLYCEGDFGLSLGTWTDLTLAGNHLVQATGSKQGSIITNAVNGHTALRLDGVDDFYKVTFTLAQPCWVHIVYKQITVGAGSVHDVVFDGGVGPSVLLTRSGSNDTTMFFGSAPGSAAIFANGSYSYVTVQADTTDTARENGTQKISGNFGANAFGGLTLGALADGSRSTNIEVARVVVGAGTLSSVDLDRLEKDSKIRFAL